MNLTTPSVDSVTEKEPEVSSSETPIWLRNSNVFQTDFSSGEWISGNRFFVMDLDGDGMDDLLGRWPSGKVSVWKGYGNILRHVANFTTPFTDAVGWNDGHRFLVMDLDGDGKDELLCRYGSGRIAVWKSDGYVLRHVANFTTQYSDASGWNEGKRFIVMDLDGDRKDELLVIFPDGYTGVLKSDGKILRWAGGLFGSGKKALPFADSSGGLYNYNRYFVMDFDGNQTDEMLIRYPSGYMQILAKKRLEPSGTQPDTEITAQFEITKVHYGSPLELTIGGNERRIGLEGTYLNLITSGEVIDTKGQVHKGITVKFGSGSSTRPVYLAASSSTPSGSYQLRLKGENQTYNVPTSDLSITVLGHPPLVTSITPNIPTLKAGGNSVTVTISGSNLDLLTDVQLWKDRQVFPEVKAILSRPSKPASREVILSAAMNAPLGKYNLRIMGGGRTVDIPITVLPSDTALAYRWAPIHYQDVDKSGGHARKGRSDFLTKINFDGDWNTADNWETPGPYLAHVYYSVVSTRTHWYILYAFYHPRDWSDFIPDPEHENDMEGLLAIITRDGSPYGKLEAIVTVFHHDFYSYVNPDSHFKGGGEDVDGPIQFQVYRGFHHPLTKQEAKGHGVKAFNDILDRAVFTGNYRDDDDYVVYYPSLTVAEEPSSIKDRFVQYKLINIFDEGEDGLWRKKDNRNVFVQTGTHYGQFQGDESGTCGEGLLICDEDEGTPPWMWDDTGTKYATIPWTEGDKVSRGAIAKDPAYLTKIYFKNTGLVETTYISNPYTNIKESTEASSQATETQSANMAQTSLMKPLVAPTDTMATEKMINTSPQVKTPLKSTSPGVSSAPDIKGEVISPSGGNGTGSMGQLAETSMDGLQPQLYRPQELQEKSQVEPTPPAATEPDLPAKETESTVTDRKHRSAVSKRSPDRRRLPSSRIGKDTKKITIVKGDSNHPSLTAGGKRITVTLRGSNLGRVTAVQVVQDGQAVSGVKTWLRSSRDTSLKVTFRAPSGTPPGNYQVRLLAGDETVDIPMDIASVTVQVPAEPSRVRHKRR